MKVINRINKTILQTILGVVLICITVLGCTGCNTNSQESKKLSIVTTIFPEYDWVRNILGEKTADVELTMLIDNGVDLHSFQPSVSDIVKISDCDIFIYVGGESDSWVKDALKNKTNNDMAVIDMMSYLSSSLKEEEVVEGMQSEEEEEHEDEAHSEAPEYDEHVWLSIRNAEKICSYIAETLSGKDPENASVYSKNLTAYLEKLSALDSKYTGLFAKAENKTLLFADRFPFRYLTDDYGLSYYAAFLGCSAESEAGFETISFLSSKISELQLNTVFILEGAKHDIADTVIAGSKRQNIEIKALNSMQSVSSRDIEQGLDYIKIMTENLETIESSLN